jgi:hypothetical protein
VDADDRPALLVAVSGAGKGLALAAEPAWYSPRYGARVSTTRLVAEARVAGAQDIVTYLLVPAALRSASAMEVGRAHALCERFTTPDVAAGLSALLRTPGVSIARGQELARLNHAAPGLNAEAADVLTYQAPWPDE